jgi:hypothetical protein
VRCTTTSASLATLRLPFERISSHAPLPRATLGRRAGDVVQVFAPDGLREFRLVGWAAEGSPRRMLLEPA